MSKKVNVRDEYDHSKFRKGKIIYEGDDRRALVYVFGDKSIEHSCDAIEICYKNNSNEYYYAVTPDSYLNIPND